MPGVAPRRDPTFFRGGRGQGPTWHATLMISGAPPGPSLRRRLAAGRVRLDPSPLAFRARLHDLLVGEEHLTQSPCRDHGRDAQVLLDPHRGLRASLAVLREHWVEPPQVAEIDPEQAVLIAR